MARCRTMSTAGPAPSADTTGSRPRRGILQRSLDLIEDVGNKLPHPATLFAILAVLVVLASWLLHRLDVTVHNEVEDETVEVFDLLSREDRKSTRLNSSHVAISYAVFCVEKKTR